MHNGQAGGHDIFRKNLDALIPYDYYQFRLGATESEAIFLIAIGMGLATRPIAAMADAAHIVQELSRKKGKTPHLRFSACWTDGIKLYAARYASDSLTQSLFYNITEDGVIVSSEPLSADVNEWIEAQPNEALVVEKKLSKSTSF